MHIDYRHYQNIEGGKINLRLDTLIKLVKFYNLDKVARPFNMDACMDLLTGFTQNRSQPTEGWEKLKENFVANNHAGYLTFNPRTKIVESANSKLAQSLGFRGVQDIVGKPLSSILVNESLTALEESAKTVETNAASKPFIVTFRTQPPAFPIPMMAVTSRVRPSSEVPIEECGSAIFFDRKSLDEDGSQLNQMLTGFEQFIQRYPQLKAV
jgi:hypothetical protein